MLERIKISDIALDKVVDIGYNKTMRYDSLRTQTERDAELKRYAQEHPELSYSEMGKVFGIKTRQQVHQILRGKKRNKN